MPSIDEKIEARKKQAEEKEIDRKASFVARYLGNTEELDTHRKVDRTSIYKRNNFLIYDSDGHVNGSDGLMGYSGTKITYKNEVVYNRGGGTLYSYIPGPWEGQLTKLFNKAQPIAEEKNKQDEQNARDEKRREDKEKGAKFGL